jgi:hypothetical protein
MATPICEADGINGIIRLYKDHIEIEQNSLLGRFGTPSTHTIPVKHITTLTHRPPGRIRNGVIKILPANVDSNDIHTNSEPYTVRYLQTNEPAFETLTTELQNRRE